MAGVGSSLASYFGVFHRLMANRLKEVPHADGARLEALAAELKVRQIRKVNISHGFGATCVLYARSHQLHSGLHIPSLGMIVSMRSGNLSERPLRRCCL